MIRVFKTGRHVHRSPLSYPALADLFAAEIAFVERPEQADLYLFAHSVDVMEAPEAMVVDWRRRRRPVLLLSEEPFWDTLWTGRPLDREIVIGTTWGDLPVVQLNHHTSKIFHFDRIPYYLLTNHRFVNAYRYRFARNAVRSVTEWQADFATRSAEIAFMFERRSEDRHDVRWETADIIGLCAWRTRLAEACRGPGVLHLGRSWQPQQPRRQDLLDWHVDKLMRLDGAVCSMAAFENTHQPNYVTEKFFDAMACGARPLYYAAEGHRIHDFGVPPEAWLNFFGLSSDTAAERLHAGIGLEEVVQPAYCEAFRHGQDQLAGLFSDVGVLFSERQRLHRSVIEELHGILGLSDVG